MNNFAVYAQKLDSYPELLRLWLDYPRHKHSKAQIALIYAGNAVKVRLWEILQLNETMRGLSHDFIPDLLLPYLGSLVVVPELQRMVDDLAVDYARYVDMVGNFDQDVPQLDKQSAVEAWWFVHCGTNEVSGEWLEDDAKALLKELLGRSKATWLKEQPSPELDAVLRHFGQSSMVCPKCGCTEAKRNGLDRHGNQRYKCKGCGSRY